MDMSWDALLLNWYDHECHARFNSTNLHLFPLSLFFFFVVVVVVFLFSGRAYIASTFFPGGNPDVLDYSPCFKVTVSEAPYSPERPGFALSITKHP